MSTTGSTLLWVIDYTGRYGTPRRLHRQHDCTHQYPIGDPRRYNTLLASSRELVLLKPCQSCLARETAERA